MILSKQKELDANSRAIQQIEFIGQLRKSRQWNCRNESMFVLTILEKIKETILKFS